MSIALVAASIALVAFRAAPADTDPSDGSVVMIAERHLPAESESVIRAVEAQVGDFGVDLRVEWVDDLDADVPSQIVRAQRIARAAPSLAVFWCDLVRADQVYLYFASDDGDRVLSRALAGTGRGGIAEATAIIVRSSVEAVLAGITLGESVSSEPDDGGAAQDDGGVGDPGAAVGESGSAAPEEPPEGEDEEEDVGRLAVSVAYELDVLSSSDPAVSAAAVEAAYRAWRHVSLIVGYAFSAPLKATRFGATIEVRRHPLWLGARSGFAVGRLRLGADLGIQLDFATDEVRANAAGVRPSTDGRDLTPSILASLHARFAVVRRVALFAAAGADFALYRPHYEVETAAGGARLLSTWPVRPRFTAGLEVSVW